jgi:hypothetical protein
MKIPEIIGNVYGRYTVTAKAAMRGNQKYYECVCECGSIKEVRGSSLRYGDSNSCGCLTVDSLIARVTTHGSSQDRLFGIHTKMRHRCNNPKNKGYLEYGAKGIGLCPEWLDYLVFKQWAMSAGYADNLTIDRIDGSLGYFPENCRWATYTTQARNRSKSKNLKSSHYIGVSQQTGYVKWVAGVKIGRKQVHLGTF